MSLLLRIATPLALTAVMLGACGGEPAPATDGPAGTFPVRIERASFPKRQRLAEQSRMRLTVRNTGSETVPDVTVSLDSFSQASAQRGLADRRRPVWIVDRGPRGGGTDYVETWALGPLPPGASKAFVWRVTPVVAGRHVVRWRIGASLDGAARAVLGSDRPAAGRFVVQISPSAGRAVIDPETVE